MHLILLPSDVHLVIYRAMLFIMFLVGSELSSPFV